MFRSARYILILMFVLVVCHNGFGQVRPGVKRPPGFDQRVISPNQLSRVQAVKERYISRRLNLTPEQSEKFWPVYRRYQDALTAVRRLKRQNNSNTEADGSEQIRRELYYESEIVNIRKFYTDEFLKILPPDKVSELFKAEREFTDELIRQLRERRANALNPAN